MDHAERDGYDSGRVDQLFTGYSRTGMRALRSTFPDTTLREQWEQALLPYLRLVPFGKDDPPPCTFTYLTFGNGIAAVLRRVRSGDSTGRNNAHALIGPEDLLGPIALELTCWDRWVADPDNADLRPLTRRDLSVSGFVTDELDDDANGCADFAVPLIASVLAEPGVRLSSIALPQERIVPTLRLFERVLTPLFAGAQPVRTWSFSTYEVTDAEDAGPYRPELIFIPGLPNHAGEVSHRRIFFDDVAPRVDEYHHLASDLFQRYYQLGYERYGALLAETVGTVPTVSARIQYLRRHGLIRRATVSATANPAPPPPFPTGAPLPLPGVPLPGPVATPQTSAELPVPQVQPQGQPQAQPQGPYRAVPNWQSAVGASVPVASSTGVARVTSQDTGTDDGDIVRKLVRARNEEEVRHYLRRLRGQDAPVPSAVPSRWNLVLGHNVFGFLQRQLWLWDLMVAYGQVFEFVFGPGAKLLRETKYFSLVHDHLLKDGRNDPLFACMVYYLLDDQPLRRLCAQLFREQSRGLRAIPVEPAGMAGASGGGALMAAWGARLVAFFGNRKVLILLGLAAVVTTCVIVALLLVQGGPAQPGVSPPGTSPTETSPPPPSPTETSPPPPSPTRTPSPGPSPPTTS